MLKVISRASFQRSNTSLFGTLSTFPFLCHQNPRLRPVSNPPFLLNTRTKSGFQPDFGPDMQESYFWRKVSVFLGPSSCRANIAVFLDSNPSISHSI